MKTLFVTIGTDKQIIYSIKMICNDYDITYLYLLGSTNVKTTEIIKKIRKEINIAQGYYQFSNPEDVSLIIDELITKAKIRGVYIDQYAKEKFNNNKIYLDFTYGTKAMSAAVFYYFIDIIGVNKIIYVGGKRDDKTGKVFQPKPVSISVEIFTFISKKNLILKNIVEKKDFKSALTIINSIPLKSTNLISLEKIVKFYSDFLDGTFKLKEKLSKYLQKNIFSKDDITNIKKMQNQITKYLDKREKDRLYRFMFEILFFADKTKIAFLNDYFNLALSFFNIFLEKYLSFIACLHYKKQFIISDNEPPTLNGKITNKKILMKKEAQRIKKLKKNQNIITKLVQIRNNSIYAHGFNSATKNDAEESVKIINSLLKEPVIIQYADKMGFTVGNNFAFYYPTLKKGVRGII